MRLPYQSMRGGHVHRSLRARSRPEERRAQLPLWHFFIAVQFLDYLWAAFILTGIEKARVTPGFLAASPLNPYHMPYTHSLAAAPVWSLLAGPPMRRTSTGRLAREPGSPSAQRSSVTGSPIFPSTRGTSRFIRPRRISWGSACGRRSRSARASKPASSRLDLCFMRVRPSRRARWGSPRRSSCLPPCALHRPFCFWARRLKRSRGPRSWPSSATLPSPYSPSSSMRREAPNLADWRP